MTGQLTNTKYQTDPDSQNFGNFVTDTNLIYADLTNSVLPLPILLILILLTTVYMRKQKGQFWKCLKKEKFLINAT